MSVKPEFDALAPPSPELTKLLDAARADLPRGAEWLQLSAQMTPLWGDAGAAAPPDAGPLPANVSPDTSASGGASGAGVVGAKAGALATAGKWAAVISLVGAVGTGAWLSVREPPPTAAPQPAVVASAVPSATAPVEALPPAVPSTPPVSAPETVASVSERGGAVGPDKASVGPRATPSELALLTQARDALATNPARALALCRQHQQIYPRGQLAQEREVLSIEALERLHRDTEAGQRRTRFGKTFPDSAHRSRVQGPKP